MATYVFDLDGTLVHSGSITPLPGAVPMLRTLKALGHQIVVLTRRSDDSPLVGYTADSARKAMAALGIADAPVLLGMTSPRVLVNDHGARAVNHPTDKPWSGSTDDLKVGR